MPNNKQNMKPRTTHFANSLNNVAKQQNKKNKNLVENRKFTWKCKVYCERLKLLAFQKAKAMFNNLIIMKLTIKEKQLVGSVAKTLILQLQLASLYKLMKRPKPTSLQIDFQKKVWQKCKVAKHTNQLTKNLNKTYKLTILVCFQLRTSSSSENMQSYKNENY